MRDHLNQHRTPTTTHDRSPHSLEATHVRRTDQLNKFWGIGTSKLKKKPAGVHGWHVSSNNKFRARGVG
jgi:hypothetical protein